mgnify:CR=1 FL=1
MTITDGGTRLCTGTMINNVNQDYELYFLTSQNCLGGHEDWIFMFNYESSSCSNQDGITNQTVSGATLLVNHYESDFALLKLEENPPQDYDIYFSGWDITGNNPFNCTSIHHPVGDIKKISQHTGVAISDGWFFDDDTHWKINEWSSGITEPGSYGAPLFNENKQMFENYLNSQKLVRKLDAIFLIDNSGKLLMSTDRNQVLYMPPSAEQLKMVLNDERPLKILNAYKNTSAALMRLANYDNTFIYIIKYLDPKISQYLTESSEALDFYYTVQDKRTGIKFSFEDGIQWQEPGDNFIHHDIFQLPNGNYIGLGTSYGEGPIPIGPWTPLFQGLGFVKPPEMII